DPDALARAHGEELAQWRRLFLTSLGFTVPLVLVHTWYMHSMTSMGMGAHPGMSEVLATGADGAPASTACELLMWALATPVQFYVGWR
ncbi:unnamed protein product, partial [Heterosigma akashiwo]